jgi:hypothetical protein
MQLLSYILNQRRKSTDNDNQGEGHRRMVAMDIFLLSIENVSLGSFKILKILQDSPSHRIFERMHGALNIDKKITNYTVWL